MVNARRPDPITRREFPLIHPGVTRREIFRRRLLRDRPSVARRLFIDRDEIPTEITAAANNRENIPFDLSFAPLPLELNPDPVSYHNHPPIPAGEESGEDDTESLSDASTISINLDGSTDGIPPGLLRAWERNAEIRRSPATLDQQIQTDSFTTPPRDIDSPTDFYTPNYSPIPLEELDPEPTEISLAEDNLVDFEVNQILDYLNSEEFLDSIDEL